jgi:hypothetical protein
MCAFPNCLLFLMCDMQSDCADLGDELAHARSCWGARQPIRLVQRPERQECSRRTMHWDTARAVGMEGRGG